MAYVAEISDRLQVLAHGRPGHIIDQLIAERGGRLVEHPAWPLMRGPLWRRSIPPALTPARTHGRRQARSLLTPTVIGVVCWWWIWMRAF